MFLTELGQERFLEPLAYCVKELTGNAQKANIKRTYFHEKGLTITDKEDYRLGMEEFHRSLVKNASRYMQKLKERNLYIIVTFQVSGTTLSIEVRNNAEMLPHEQARIYARIVRSRAFSSFYEALNSSIDTTEGAGLGVLILLQTLKRFGLEEKAFSIESANGRTVARLTIPCPRCTSKKSIFWLRSLPATSIHFQASRKT